jgi:GNAT superfamily N-acetyltransferase
VVQSTLTRQTGELYIDLVKSQVQRTGLGQELLGRAIRVAEQSGTKVNTVAGHLRGVNKDILLRAGLEATPAYKLRQRAGFTRVIEAPTEANSFSLIMGR